jgi:hypothetical protein
MWSDCERRVVTYEALAINVSNLIVLVRTRRPFELHVTNVVASLDDDPSVQVYLKTAKSLARAHRHCAHTPLQHTQNTQVHVHGLDLHVLVLGLVVKQIFVVRLLGRIRRQ